MQIRLGEAATKLKITAQHVYVRIMIAFLAIAATLYSGATITI